jgi:hypothetical protein
LLAALYAQAAVLPLAENIGWDRIISLKKINAIGINRPSAFLLAALQMPTTIEKQDGQTYPVQFWDTQSFSEDYPQPVRVVRSEETVTEHHDRQRQLQLETTSHEWLWITTLEPPAFPATQVRRLGQDRWKVENNGWNDLTQNWALSNGGGSRFRPASAL